MNKDLARINLNLLMALDALLEEKNVTKAGKKLFITQSAMSNCLKQLREIFKDELFIRGQASRLIPTSFALSLAPRVASAIEKLNCVFKDPGVFNPLEAKATFTLGLSDYTEFLFLPMLTKFLMKEAPGINILVKHVTYLDTPKRLESDDLDMAVGIFRTIPSPISTYLLYEDDVVCVAAESNPILAKPLSKKLFAESKHLVILYTETRSELISEQIVKELGYERQAIVTVPNTIPAVHVLRDTDLTTLMMRKLACRYCKNSEFSGLNYQEVDFPLPHAPVRLAWHPIHENNEAHKWLRSKIIQVANEIERLTAAKK